MCTRECEKCTENTECIGNVHVYEKRGWRGGSQLNRGHNDVGNEKQNDHNPKTASARLDGHFFDVSCVAQQSFVRLIHRIVDSVQKFVLYFDFGANVACNVLLLRNDLSQSVQSSGLARRTPGAD